MIAAGQQDITDGVALLDRIDRGRVRQHILTPLHRLANTVYNEDQYD